MAHRDRLVAAHRDFETSRASTWPDRSEFFALQVSQRQAIAVQSVNPKYLELRCSRIIIDRKSFFRPLVDRGISHSPDSLRRWAVIDRTAGLQRPLPKYHASHAISWKYA